MDNKNIKGEKEESEKANSDSYKEEIPNKEIKPPRFYNLSEGVNPKIHSDEVVKEKEKKYNG